MRLMLRSGVIERLIEATSRGVIVLFRKGQNVAGFYSMVTTAIIAAAIGFGGGVYWGETEPVNHFRVFLQSGVAAIHGTAPPGDANLNMRPAEPLQAKTPMETPLIEAQPDVLAEPRTNAEAIAPAPQAAPDREGAVSSSPALEDRDNQSASGIGADSAPVASTIETEEAHAPVAPPIPAKPPRKKVTHKKPVNDVKEQPTEP